MDREKRRELRKKRKQMQQAIKCCGLLREHIAEENFLNKAQIEVCAAIIKKMSKISFFFFAKHVLEFDLLTEETHQKWADNIQSILGTKERIMRLKPRATYKSTLYGVAFILWLWCCVSPKLRLFYTSSNSLLLEEVADKLTQFLTPGNTIFQLSFGLVRDTEGKTPPKNTNDVFNVVGRSGKGFSLIMRTAGGSTVGLHPNILIVDDPMGVEDRESAVIRAKKERWFDSLNPLIVPFIENGINYSCLLFIATRWHRNDLVNHIFNVLDKNKKEKEKWDIEVESIYDENKKSNYPEFITDEQIESIKSSISDVFFSCQYINNPMSEGIRVFDEKKFHYIRSDQIDFFEGQIACFFDPSKGKASSDWPAVIWTHYKDKLLTIIDAFDKEKIELATLMPLIANRNKILNVTLMVYEDNGVSLIGDSLRRVHENINHLVYLESIRNTSNKDERILSMQPVLYSGLCRFMDDWEQRYPEMMDQLMYYAPGGQGGQYDDFPDVIQMAISHYRKSTFEFVRYEGLL